MEASTDLVKPDNYAILSQPSGDLMEVIESNIGGQQLSEFDLDRISMPAGGGKTWEVPTLEGTEPQKEIEGVIVFYKDVRSFWKEEYSGGNEPPDCSSPDAQFATGDPGVAVPDDELGRHICAQCPNAQFGSDKKGRGQACKLGRMLFVVTPEDLLPVVVSLPPTSVRPAQQFFLRLARRGVPYHGVVTKIGLDQTDSNDGIKYSYATFSMAGRLDAEAAQTIKDYSEKLAPAFQRAELRGEDVADADVVPD